MLSCQSFRDRLYDEDCRRALSGGAPAPADVALHRDACAECRQEWTEAARDLAQLPILLREDAPTSVTRHVRIAVAERSARVVSAVDWSEGVLWAVLGGVAALIASGPVATWLPGVGPLGVSLIGASLAFSVHATRRVMREALR